jgi:hypothetical protein
MERKVITLDDIERRYFASFKEKEDQWIRHLVSLSGAALTLLVSLQGSYVPLHPQGLILLQICWTSLAVGLCAGVLFFYGEAYSNLEAAKNLQESREVFGDTEMVAFLTKSNGVHFRKRLLFRASPHVLVACFLVGLVCLAWFAVINVGRGLG